MFRRRPASRVVPLLRIASATSPQPRVAVLYLKYRDAPRRDSLPVTPDRSPISKPPWHRLYRTARWQRLREWHLQRQPACVTCGHPGSSDNNLDVDHIEPHKGDLLPFFAETNLQTLCHRVCHPRKTAREVRLAK